MTQRFISDYIRDRDQFQCDRFNLIQAPCGAGKSYFVSTSLLSIFPEVEPWEVVFVTSRAITVAQQVTHYPKLCNYDNETKKYAEFWRGTLEPVDDERDYICLMTFDKVIDILRDQRYPGHDPFGKVKIFVVDECHSLVTDLFISGMDYLAGHLYTLVKYTNTYVIGMTATPRVFLESVHKHGYLIHKVLEHIEPLYKANQLVATTWKELPLMLTDTLSGQRSIVMTTNIDRAIELQRKVPNSAIVTSRHSKKWVEQDMGELWDSIVNNETLPDECNLPTYGDDQRVIGRERGKLNVLIFTSVAREGLTIRAQSGVRNVICCFGDEMHITQFMGRCRFNVENLVVCDDPAARHSYNDYTEKQRADCHSFVYGHNDSYFEEIQHLVTHDVADVVRFIGEDEYKPFWDYLESNWLVDSALDVTADKICGTAVRAAIMQKAKDYQVFKLRKDRTRTPSFPLLCEIIADRRTYSFEHRDYWLRNGKKKIGGYVLLPKLPEITYYRPEDERDDTYEDAEIY